MLPIRLWGRFGAEGRWEGREVRKGPKGKGLEKGKPKKNRIRERKGKGQGPKPLNFQSKHASSTDHDLQYHDHHFYIKPLDFPDTTTL